MFGTRISGHAVRVSVLVALASCGIVDRAFAQVPSPWTARDIGSPTPAGSTTYDSTGNVFTIDAGGSDIWGTSDRFHFVYRQLSGDGEIVARVESITRADAWSKAGVMIRSSLTAGSAHAFALVSAGNGIAFQRRRANGGTSTNTAGAASAPPPVLPPVRARPLLGAAVSPHRTRWGRGGGGTNPPRPPAHLRPPPG